MSGAFISRISGNRAARITSGRCPARGSSPIRAPNDAVVRNLEIVGEAARRVPAEVCDRLPAIDWRRVADMRNILAHAYFGIDDDILWDVIQNQSPAISAVARPAGKPKMLRVESAAHGISPIM